MSKTRLIGSAALLFVMIWGALAAPTGFAQEPTPIPVGSPNTDWTPIIEEFNGVEMVLVPPGCFMMGNPMGDTDERPAHEVCFDAPYWIDLYEVTNAQFAAFDGRAARDSYWDDDQRPREQITWTEAQTFCESRDARLPTAAEWEYAARGPESWRYPWGNDFEADNVVYGENSGSQTAEVGSRPGGASWVGALDLSGNVWEWVADWYDPDYYATLEEGVINPTGPTAGDYRVLRGGSWFVSEEFLCMANCYRDLPYFWINYSGFRCAQSAETAAEE